MWAGGVSGLAGFGHHVFLWFWWRLRRRVARRELRVSSIEYRRDREESRDKQQCSKKCRASICCIDGIKTCDLWIEYRDDNAGLFHSCGHRPRIAFARFQAASNSSQFRFKLDSVETITIGTYDP
jgi:hypothetical protein